VSTDLRDDITNSGEAQPADLTGEPRAIKCSVEYQRCDRKAF